MNRWIATALAIAVGLSGPALAQETEYQTVGNPFLDAFPYAIGEDLQPLVDIDGVRWNLVRVALRGDRAPEPGTEVPILVTVEFENRRTDGVGILVILLLEDGQGTDMQRLRIDPFRASGGRFKEAGQRFKVPAEVLSATEQIYVFCEVQ